MMKQKNTFTITLFAILSVLMFLPLIQQLTKFVTVRGLDGATVEAEQPELTFDSYKDMSYQAQLEKYLADHFGFRESVIRLYNQYLLLYRKTYAADVVVGKDRWLYSKSSVLDHYRQRPYAYAADNEALKRRFETDLSRLKTVQDLLAQRGTQLFVLICPAKDIVYPENLPQGGPYTMSDGLRAIDYYPQAFAENGIHFIDVCNWFQQIRDTVSYPLFPKRGMHWSNIACVHAADSIFRYMEHLTGKNMPDMTIGPMYHDATRKPDDDLERNLNLVWGILPAEQNYYADVEVTTDSTTQKLNLITMGDSFFWNMCFALPMDSLFASHPYWYYFSTIFYDPEHTNVSQINLMEELDRADVVMISLSATQLYDINHGFLSQAMLCLKSRHPANLNAVLDEIKREMQANDEWYQLLVNKAAEQGKPLEQVMDEDALYMFNQTPEKYTMRAALEQIKRTMRNDPTWYNALLEKAHNAGKDIEQVLEEDALYILNQEPEKYLN